MVTHKTRNNAKKRLSYFFDTERRGRRSVHDAVNSLQAVGQVAVIGGMLRDLILFGNRGFKSDVDLVVNVDDHDGFMNFVTRSNGVPNRFGGYSMVHGRWQVDVWPLQRTWAHVEGYVEVSDFKDLTEITFFDCDAILFNLTEQKLIFKEGYFDKIDQKLIDINLKPNPNPIGNAVRAFKYALDKDVIWGRDLAQFVYETIEVHGWISLIEKEEKSSRTNFMRHFNELDLRHALEVSIEANEKFFDPRSFSDSYQLKLAL